MALDAGTAGIGGEQPDPGPVILPEPEPVPHTEPGPVIVPEPSPVPSPPPGPVRVPEPTPVPSPVRPPQPGRPGPEPPDESAASAYGSQPGAG